MFWHKLNEHDQIAFAYHVYIAALEVTDPAGAVAVCCNALRLAGAHIDEAERMARRTNEDYLKVVVSN